MLEDFQMLAEGLDHPEGVAWGPDGFVYAGGEAGQIWRVSLDGEVGQVGDTGGGILGVALDGDGRVYACDEERGEVVRVDPRDGSVRMYSAGTRRERPTLPNACAFDAAGNLYFSDSGDAHADNGKVFRVAPGGETEVWTRALPRYPNGVCVSPDGAWLYVAESYFPGVSRVPIDADGSAGEPAIVAELPGTVPDGVALDTEGNLYVTCYRPDRIVSVTPSHETEVVVDDPEAAVLSAPTNVAFVGEGLRRMVVANVGESHLSIADVGAAGVPLFYPRVP